MNVDRVIDEGDDAAIDLLLDELASKHRRGESIALPEGVAANPATARRVMQLLNAMLAMEGLATPFPELKQLLRRKHAPLERVGVYRIVREIGRGGMGVVYEAEQPGLERTVALKVLPDYAQNDPVAVQRFEREAKAIARLHHTNIVPIFEVGRDGDRRYFAMQRIDGRGLDRVIDARRRPASTIVEQPGEKSGDASVRNGLSPTQQRSTAASDERHAVAGGVGSTTRRVNSASRSFTAPTNSMGELEPSSANAGDAGDSWTQAVGLPFFRAAAIAGAQAASALGHAHARGVVHRDIKPSNLLVDQVGCIWVTDFGLAKTAGDDLTHSNAVLGTVRYLAPERFSGGGDHRSDIYSLGLTLYELVVGKAAFPQRDQAELIHAITKTEPPRPTAVEPALPRDLETILLKAIDKNPNRRYGSAAELQGDLERFADDEPIAARRASVWARLQRRCRKNPIAAALTAAIVFLLLAFGVHLAFSRQRLGEELAISRRNELEARRRLRESHVERARALQRGLEVGRRHAGLEAIAKAAAIDVELSKEELRDDAIAGMVLLDLRAVPMAPIACRESLRVEASQTAFDSALYRYATFGEHEVLIRRTADRQVSHRLPHPTKERFWDAGIRFSPNDGALFVDYSLNANRIDCALFDLAQNRATRVLRNGNGAFLANGHLLGCDWPDGHLQRIDPATGNTVWRSTWRLPTRCEFTPSHDGQRLLVWSRFANAAEVRRLADGKRLATYRHDADLTAVAWSHDDRLLAAAQRNFETIVWNLQTGGRQTTLVGHLAGPTRIVFHPTRAIVATAAWDESTKFWNPYDGRLLLSSPTALDRFSSDGTRLATRWRSEATLWELADDEVERSPRLEPLGKNFGGPQADRIVVDFSPDESMIACVQPGSIRIFDCRTMTVMASLPAPGVDFVAFDADGENLFAYAPMATWRWPIRKTAGNRAVARIGPPELRPIATQRWSNQAQTSLDRSLVTYCDPDTRLAVVARLGDFGSAKHFGPVSRVKNVALTADNAMIAAAGWRSNRIQIWDTRTARSLATLRANAQQGNNTPGLAFSPDGRRLLSQAFKLEIWDATNWQLLATQPALETGVFDVAPTFSKNGRLLAVAISPDRIALYDGDTLELLARLKPQDSASLQTLRLSDRGNYLATTTYDHRVRIWNLAEMRRRLGAMGLGWSASSATTDAPNSSAIPPTAVEPLEVVGTALADVRRAAACRIACSWATDFWTFGSTAASRLERANMWLLLGSAARARDEMERAAAADPANAAARLALGLDCLRRGDRARALVEFNATLAARPNDREALLGRAKANEGLQNWRAAVADYDAILVVNPADGVARILRNIARNFSGEHAAAARDFAAIHHGYFYDQNFFAHWMRALARCRDRKQIEATIPRLIGFGDAPGNVENAIAWALVSGPRDCRFADLALPLAQKALEHKPNEGSYWNTMAFVLLWLGRDNEAKAAIDRRLKLDKQERTAFDAIALAHCYARAGQMEAAKAELAHAESFRDRKMIARWTAIDVAEVTQQIADAKAALGLR